MIQRTRSHNTRSQRTITKVGRSSYSVTLPIDWIRTLGWRDRQKVVLSLDRRRITIRDWKK